MTSNTTIRDMEAEDELFVGSCTHVNENEEWSTSCQRRLPWLRQKYEEGLRIKVALLNGAHAGFAFLMPIENAPWGPAGRDLLSIQCVTVLGNAKHKGIGLSLLSACEQEAHSQGMKGITVTSFYHDFWFMPATFFEKCGFQIACKQGHAAILWKAFDPSAEVPSFPVRRYQFKPEPGKVVVDLFWSRSCLTTDTEAQRVREVVGEFDRSVVLKEYCSDNPEIRSRYGIFRAIFINGKEIGWGYEAPKDGLRLKIWEARG